ncbi:centromere kinetochore component CENP-T-domain-containing protein [Cercophora newfieldiana]|uniref:Centromere kinetochore component CENP-T-domain-containing protein n=1 Tax=Cercophora newfieldiana TaxID=92897 RepID=A0AA40CYN8_9PEZI|nr:centromere kinetochore component CENP-T-domain-containing protein [Cercophora newfieldiana]
MARESHPPRPSAGTGTGTSALPTAAATATTTPSRRAVSTDAIPPSTAARTLTPGSHHTLPRFAAGLSASARKQPGPSATPHARAAFRTINSQRAAAVNTPHRQGAGGRRRSARELRETPRNFLLPLGRVLARNTEVIVSSSSATKGGRGEDTVLEEEEGGYDDEEEEEELPKRPRLSLPIDEDEDDDDDLRPHRSAGLEDENFTMQSIEMPRRAYSEQPSRLSMGSMRYSDFGDGLGVLAEVGEDVGIDSGFFPPMEGIDEGNFELEEMPLFERSELDIARRETLVRDSDFEFEVPLGMDENTVVLAPQIGESPVRQPEDHDEPEPMLHSRSGADDSSVADGDAGGFSSGAEDVDVDVGVEQEEVTAKSAAKRPAKKKTTKMSKYGIEYPSLPQGVVKRLATTFAKTSGAKGKITPDALKAIMQASDWFFEQVGDDLQAYAKHAHRKTIEESDMLTLMKRYVLFLYMNGYLRTGSQMTPFALAQRHLPRELLQDLRMTPPVPLKKRRKTGGDAEDEDVT